MLRKPRRLPEITSSGCQLVARRSLCQSVETSIPINMLIVLYIYLARSERFELPTLRFEALGPQRILNVATESQVTAKTSGP
jgi:hypothetical protein